MKTAELRWMLLIFSLLGLLSAVFIPFPVLKLALLCALSAACLVILYRNMDSLTGYSEENPKNRTIKWITVFNGALLLLCIGAVWLGENGYLGNVSEEWLAVALVSVVMVVLGNLAPKIPFNRYTGLRLPWTVRDEDTWRLAHRILGYISFPLVFLYGALLLCGVEIGTATGMVILSWIIIPGGISFLFYRRKFP